MQSLKEITIVFLKLGLTSFGGPAAHVALMERELVTRRAWLSRQTFLDMHAASQIIPGPNSTELALHIGLLRGGYPGFFAAGLAFILPAALIVGSCAYAYQLYGTLPAFASLLYGIKPVIIAVILDALWKLGKSALKTELLFYISFIAALINWAGLNEILVLLISGLAHYSLTRARAPLADAGAALVGTSAIAQIGGGLGLLGTAPQLSGLFLIFLKAGSLLFGGGYVLLAFLRADLVENLGWLTEAQLLDAVAIGQFTPGPLFTTATFIGYLLKGPAGALVATIGIFLPAFVFVALSAPYIPRLRKSPAMSAILDGLNAASLSLMAVVTVNLGVETLQDFPAILITLVSLFLLLRFQVSSTWLVLGGALLGFFMQNSALI